MSSPPAVIFQNVGDYIKSMQDRQEAIDNLCHALHAFLSQGIQAGIQSAKQPRPKPPRPTIEDLNKAQEKLDLMHAQLEALQNMCEDMPDKFGEMMRLTQMPQIQRWLEEAEREVAYIQKAIEEPEPEQGSPWDGSHQLSALCTICAKGSDQVASSPKVLNRAIMEAGWGRDSEGDFLCPDCFAATKNQQPSAALPSTSNPADSTTEV